MSGHPVDVSNDLFHAETTWFHVFHSMIQTGDISRMKPYAVTVYLVIKAHTNFKSGRSFPSIDTIVQESGISRSQVLRALKTLQSFRYITKTRVGRRNEYRLREKVCIKDEQGIPTAEATWDYLPSTVQAATAELKNVLVSGGVAESRIVHIERLQVNVTHASGNAVVFNAQEVACMPDDVRQLLRSWREKLKRTPNQSLYTDQADTCHADT
jgi:DNA-binding transcriptional MocR family regulator